MARIKVLEAFGGMGAPRMALENLFERNQLKFIDYVEYDQLPVGIYNKLYDHSKLPESIVDYNLRPDVLIHGSPCQDFSMAGKGLGGFLGTATRSSLMWETVRLIEEFGQWKPKVVIWENVKGVLNKTRSCQKKKGGCGGKAEWKEEGTIPCGCGKTTKTNYDNFNLYLDSMTKLGYKNTFKNLIGTDFGIPQKRQRIFTVSILNTASEFLHFDFDNIKKTKMKPLRDFLEPEDEVDVKYYITQKSMMKAILDDKIKIVNNEVQTITTKQWRWNNAGVIKVPLTGYNAENYVHVSFKDDSSINTLTATGAQSRVKIFVPKKYDELPVFKLQDGKYYHLRIITPREAWRLMGFTDKDFDKFKNYPDASLYQVAGNSIIVNVLEGIFKELFALEGEKNV